jgi:hypothetical protein
LRTSSGEANDAASRVAHVVASNGTSSVAQPAELFVFIEAVTHPRESLQRLMSQIFSTESLQRHTSVTHPTKTFQRRTPQKFSRDTSLTYLLFVCDTPQRISPETHVSDMFHKSTPETHLSDTPHKNIPETHTTEILQRHNFDLLAFCL